jgi:hypothetical protein
MATVAERFVMSNAPDPNSPDVRPPFWRHRYVYMVLKFAVLVAGVIIAVRLWRG